MVVEIDNKNGDFGGFVTWPFRQFGNSGVDQEYPPLRLDLPTPKHDIEVFHSQKFTYQDKTLYTYRAK